MLHIKPKAARIYQAIMTLISRESLQLHADRPNAVIMLVPDYGNIGDLAIRYAQERFVQEIAPHMHVQSVPISQTYKVIRKLRRSLRRDDLVLLVGGGSMGDLYPRAQLGREFVAKYLRPHRIVSFPQSIIYMNRPGKQASAAREAKALAASADWMTLFARETISLEVMREFYPGTVGFSPDIVFSLISTFQAQPEAERSGTLLALRQDAERAVSESAHRMISDVAHARGNVTLRDHGVPDDEVDQIDPHDLPLRTLALYRRHELVITDRLHGMIFAVVTGTPCVVIPNSNHKITGTYDDWLAAQCRFVEVVRNPTATSLEAAIERVTAPASRDSYREVEFDFSNLADAILGENNERYAPQSR